MTKRFLSPLAAGALACTAALALAVSASGAPSLPTLHVALNGTKGVSVSGSTVSGAVNVTSSFSGKAPTGPNSNGPDFGLVRLNPGVTLQQANGAVVSHHGDLNALTPYGSLFVDASAPGALQTVLTPGNYVALNLTGNGQPAFAQFTVTKSSSPAALPAAKATQSAIEFGFRGPRVLHNGTMLRAENQGWLVHMINLIGVRNAATGKKLVKVLRAGHDRQAMKLATSFINTMGPTSPGAMQQAVLHAKPGYYVEACFMDTTDGREHTRLGMERLVKVVK
jgi:hypothetical protein